MTLLPLLLALPVLGQDTRSPLLPVGETVQGRIEDGDPEVRTEILDQGYTSVPTVGRSFRVQVEEAGLYHFELRSWSFDTYVVLRDSAGHVMAEDDDGGITTNSRLVVELEAGSTYSLEACALHGLRGPFVLVSGRGVPAALPPRERAAAELDDLRKRVEVRESRQGPESAAVALALSDLGRALLFQGAYGEAREAFARSLAIREEVLGPEHADTAESLNNLATTLLLLGELEAAWPLQERALAIQERVLGPDHLDTATSLVNLASLHRSKGDLPRARSLQERAAAIQEKVLGPDHPDVAASLNELMVILSELGDLEAALAMSARALAIRERTLGAEHSETVSTLTSRAMLLLAQGAPGAVEARELFQRALTAQEEHQGPRSPGVADLCFRLGQASYTSGDYRGAAEAFDRFVTLREELDQGEDLVLAEGLAGLGASLQMLGDLGRARRVCERAVAIVGAVYGPDSPLGLSYLNNLAVLHQQLGEYEQARHLMERIVRRVETSAGQDHRDLATYLTNLGDVMRMQGDLVSARRSFERALETWESGPEHVDQSTCEGNLGLVCYALGDLEEARIHLERGLELHRRLRGPDHPYASIPLTNLGGLFEDQGDLESAQQALEEALSLTERTFGPDSPYTLRTRSGVARIRLLRGGMTEARDMYEDVLQRQERVLGTDHPEVAGTLSGLATVLWTIGELEAALPLLERAVEILRVTLPDHDFTATMENGLARLLTSCGDLERARALLPPSPPSAQLRQTLLGLTEAEAFRYLAGLRRHLDLQLSLVAAEEGELLEDGYDSLLAWKGQVSRNLIASQRHLARQLDDDQRELVARLRSVQARLSRLLTEDGGQEQLDALREERNRIELELRRTLAVRVEGQDASVDSVRAAIPAGAAVIDLLLQPLYVPAIRAGEEASPKDVWTDDHVIAWVLRPAGEEPGLLRVDLGPAARMEAATRAFLEDRMTRGKVPVGRESEDPGSVLRRVLWDPLAGHLGGTEALFVSPDGFLGTLPFETIPLADGSFLLERFGVVYLQDVTSLTRRPTEPAPDYGSLLAMGGVDFLRADEWKGELEAGPASTRGSFTEFWTPLRHTGFEVDAVEAIHDSAFGEQGSRQVLRASSPTEERLKVELSRHSVLHLATHGFFQPEGTPSMWESALDERGRRETRMTKQAAHLVGEHPGLLSGLVCAGANRSGTEDGSGREDGYLTAEEVGWLDLSGVELVVLSACETGLGRAESGEGLIGLRRAFRTAGASTVISSLWSVKDESTAELMRAFYTNLWVKGMGRSEALRAAQLAMLQRNRMEHGAALPATWGAFVLSGEWR